MEEIDRYKYLWDGSDPNWVLLKVSERCQTHNEQIGMPYLVYNVATKGVLIIDDNVLGEKVIRMMLATGVRITSIKNGKIE